MGSAIQYTRKHTQTAVLPWAVCICQTVGPDRRERKKTETSYTSALWMCTIERWFVLPTASGVHLLQFVSIPNHEYRCDIIDASSPIAFTNKLNFWLISIYYIISKYAIHFEMTRIDFKNLNPILEHLYYTINNSRMIQYRPDIVNRAILGCIRTHTHTHGQIPQLFVLCANSYR